MDMKYEELSHFLQNIGKDPSRLIFEDELTGVYNRRFLLQYFQYKIAWESLPDHPLSLIMMDLDYFKKINDTYGHPVGDQALTFLARLLREVSGDEGLPIRYAGDEFMILLPRSGKQSAIEMGERLLRRLHAESMPMGQEGKDALRITISVGIASAPEDAQTGRALIQKADTALYYAKKQGRDRLANAGVIPAEEVFAKAALYQLQGEDIAGRKDELGQVSQCLQSFSQGKSHFILVEGGSGMGKTTFLETIWRNLAKNKSLRQARVSASIQEMFRPYYLATKFLVELLNEREDKGAEILESLDRKEISHLSRILPHLGSPPEPASPEEESAVREGLFNTLVHFLPRIVDGQPLILLIDDLQFADEASLLLLRHVTLRGQIPLFLCGTAADPLPILLEGHRVPLDSFYKAYHQELSIHRLKLIPLTAADIAEHLEKMFPGVKIPGNFDRDLEQITQGNPLFLGEILCKLVLEQKITLSGQQWVIAPPAQDDLPKSLESIIRQKIQNLDEESRKLIFQASTFGEDVPLSLLTGSSKIMESKVLEFVDQAVSLGLMNMDFQVNDQNLHFRGKRILEIMEEEIQPEEKRELHDQVGKYQENLFQKFLVPSAAPLIYHFRRASNEEKVKTYEQFERVQDLKVFNAAEAFNYSGERRKELPPPGDPLDPESLAQVPSLIKCLLTALRNIQLYPLGSESVITGNRQVREAIEAILEKNETLSLFQVRRALVINGQKVDLSELRFVGEELIKLFDRLEVQGIVFRRGISQREVNLWLEAFGRSKPKVIDKDYWHTFSEENHLEHIELKQIRYTLRVDGDSQVLQILQPIPGKGGQRNRSILAGVQKLEDEDLAQVPEVLRAILNAVRNIKLYPLNSKNVSASIDQLHEALHVLLTRRKTLVLAQVRGLLVVNGGKIDPRGIEPQVDGFLKFLDTHLLTSLTFLDAVTLQELKSFIGVLGQAPPGGSDTEFWPRVAKEERIKNLLFDQVFYETRVTPTQGFEDLDQLVEIVGVEGLDTELFEPIPEEQLEPFLNELRAQVADLLADGKEKETLQLLRRLFVNFPDRTIVTREKMVESCRRMLEDLTPAQQNYFAKLLSHPLLGIFREEKDPKITREISSLLHRMSTLLIQFVQYPLAGRILLNLQQRQRQLEDAGDPYAQRLAKVLERKLDPGVQKLLLSDLNSEEPFRRQNAVFLLGSLGKAVLPLLLEAIKKTDDLRVRTLAASLLAKAGEDGAALVKKEAVLGGTAEERVRILDVIEVVTRDLKAELAHALGEDNSKVRQAAFRLLERLNDSQAVELLLEYAQGKEPRLAMESIECLGKLKPSAAVGCLISLLENGKRNDFLAACCRSLGQIGDPACIQPLMKVLTQQGLFARMKSGWAEVRAAAAYALSQIPHPRAAEVLISLENDSDPRVREAAQKVMKPFHSQKASLKHRSHPLKRDGSPVKSK
jgi:diguanylate cyclase (GGDEF)-like protein